MGVNIGSSPAFLLGLFLAVAGAGLFFLRSVRPELARDYDIFFAAVGLLCGIILIFNGWRLDPILAFCQFMLTGTAIFFAFDSIRMRGVATEQARRNTETVDRDRPVSRTRVYTEAELDKFDSYDNVYEGAKPNYNSPRLRGYDDPQPRNARRSEPRRRSTSTSDLKDESRRPRSRNRPPADDGYNERPRSGNRSYPDRDRDSRPNRPRRRPAPTSSYDDWDTQDEWSDTPINTARPSRRPPRDDRYDSPATPPPTEPKNSKPNPPDIANLGRSYDEPEEDYGSPSPAKDYDSGNDYNEPAESIPGDYVVDYQPLDNSAPDYGDEYDDTGQDYDGDYDNSQDNDYDDYPDEPETRKPINFE